MRNKRDRNGKGEIRWNSISEAAWWVKELKLNEHHKSELKKICNDHEFLEAVCRIGSRYLSRQKPEAPQPEPGRSDIFGLERREYLKRWVKPSPCDMEKTLLDLKDSENKVEKLAKISRVHSIWRVVKDAWYQEYKIRLSHGDFERIRVIYDFRFMLETTPEDHPQKQAVQAAWDNEYNADFEKMNVEWIPELVRISLKHLKDVYPKGRTKTNSAAAKRWLVFTMINMLPSFGIKPTQTKDGPLQLCIEIVLDAAGQENGSVHHYIEEILREVKKPAK